VTFRQTILTCMLVVGLSAAAATADGAIIRLHSSATVDKPLIHLGDIADIYDDDEQAAARLQAITLSTSPIPGNSTRLKLDQIRSRLHKFDVAVGALEFQGSSIVLVTRRGQLPVTVGAGPRTTLATDQPRDLKSRPFSRTGLAERPTATVRTISSLHNITTADIRLVEAVVHDLVRDYLAEWAPDWGTPIIRPMLVISTVPPILSARSGNLKIVSGKVLDEGIFLLNILVPTGEPPAARTASGSDGTSTASATTTVQVRVRVTRRPKVLAARRVIAQGQVIREADLEWKEVDSLRNGASDPATVVGMEARRTIRQGDFIQVNTVKPPTLIQRDELVKVAVRFGSVRVTRDFKARRSGILNDIIELIPVNKSDRTTLLARVTGTGQAEPLNRDSDADEAESQIRLTVNTR
jgi:flagella basal body P-ring formation protein FlgA